MDWLLFLLAIFNLVSMVAMFRPRSTSLKSVPWAWFGIALLATELAWIWLPLQFALVFLMFLGGATDSVLGGISLWVVMASWIGLAWSIWQSTLARTAVEEALRSGLGHDYRSAIPTTAHTQLRSAVSFKDWFNPVNMARPDVEVIRHIPYGPAGVRQQLDVYRPREIPEGGCPVLFQIHGGAWMMGDKGSQALPLMYHLASKGWICVAANYRLSPSVGFPTHLYDCKAALCWIRQHGMEYGMQTGFVAVTGGSAGGHLCALMGLTANNPDLQPDHPNVDTSIQACIPFYGVYDFLVRYNQHPNKELYRSFGANRVLHESVEENPELWDLASPITRIHKDAPPFMIWHGTHDSLAVVTEGRIFSQKLHETSEQPVVYVELPGAEHAWEVVHSLRTEHTIDGVHRFLEWTHAQHAMRAKTVPEPVAMAEVG